MRLGETFLSIGPAVRPDGPTAIQKRGISPTCVRRLIEIFFNYRARVPPRPVRGNMQMGAKDFENENGNVPENAPVSAKMKTGASPCPFRNFPFSFPFHFAKSPFVFPFSFSISFPANPPGLAAARELKKECAKTPYRQRGCIFLCLYRGRPVPFWVCKNEGSFFWRPSRADVLL